MGWFSFRQNPVYRKTVCFALLAIILFIGARIAYLSLSPSYARTVGYITGVAKQSGFRQGTTVSYTFMTEDSTYQSTDRVMSSFALPDRRVKIYYSVANPAVNGTFRALYEWIVLATIILCFFIPELHQIFGRRKSVDFTQKI